ncbi:MAG: histidine kinase [Coriobacteriia bacterium]|nr:histidine kinase [Coriobacteriia bacterium]
MTRQLSLIEGILIGVIVLLSVTVVLSVLAAAHWAIVVVCVAGIVSIAILMIRSTIDPDRLRARQSGRMLKIAASTLTHMSTGLHEGSAQEVCKLILPATSANAVAITDTEKILGYAGAEQETHRVGSPIRTESTKKTILSAEMQVITTKEELGLPGGNPSFAAAIVVPLLKQGKVEGVLKFFYRSARKIGETEQAVAQGLATLLAMQLSLADLEYEREQAAKMEFKALQAQIRPHFLFNTINTIAALIRTDPKQARVLLREFATFYRRTLEGSLDNISLKQEYYQTLRYLGFEIARFGADRICLISEIENDLEQIQVPAFIIQPLVENSIGHGMRDNAPLHIKIYARTIEGNVVIDVSDDGVGIPKHIQKEMLEHESQNTGIALKNVDDRLRSFFGGDAHLEVQSEVGIGTTVSLFLGPIVDLEVGPDD